MTFGVALDNTVLARTTVPSCSSTPSTTLFFTMICCTGYMEHEVVRVEGRETEEGEVRKKLSRTGEEIAQTKS